VADQLPTISVVTPSYNQGRFIERTIRSVLEQDYSSLEYFVCDGGSTDQTVEVLKAYSSRLRWLSEKDKGQASAVNKGIRATKGDVIGWLNSDDVYYPTALRTAAELFALRPEVDVVYGDAHHIDTDDKVIQRYPTQQWDFTKLMQTCYLCQPAVFFRRSVIERWGYLDEALQYCMDYEYWLRLAIGGARFHHESRFLAGSRFYAETKTLSARVKVHAEINDMLKAKLGTTPNAWILAYAHVFADDKLKIKRSARARYVQALAVLSIYSSLRWNKRISLDLVKFLLSAFAADLKARRTV